MCCRWPSDNFCSYYFFFFFGWLRRQQKRPTQNYTCTPFRQFAFFFLFFFRFPDSLWDHHFSLSLSLLQPLMAFAFFSLLFSFLFVNRTDTSLFFHFPFMYDCVLLLQNNTNFTYAMKKIERKKNILFRILINDFAYTDECGHCFTWPQKQQQRINSTQNEIKLFSFPFLYLYDREWTENQNWEYWSIWCWIHYYSHWLSSEF